MKNTSTIQLYWIFFLCEEIIFHNHVAMFLCPFFNEEELFVLSTVLSRVRVTALSGVMSLHPPALDIIWQPWNNLPPEGTFCRLLCAPLHQVWDPLKMSDPLPKPNWRELWEQSGPPKNLIHFDLAAFFLYKIFIFPRYLKIKQSPLRPLQLFIFYEVFSRTHFFFHFTQWSSEMNMKKLILGGFDLPWKNNCSVINSSFDPMISDSCFFSIYIY